MTPEEDSEYYLALATSKQLQLALKYKKMYEELSDGFIGLIKETMRLLRDSDLESRQRKKVDRILKRAYALYSIRLESSPEMQHRDFSPEDEAEPTACAI